MNPQSTGRSVVVQTNDGDGWNPRPDPDGTKFNDSAYLCGYTDGFYGEPFGSHDKGRFGGFSAYRPGFSDGRADAPTPTVSL